MKPLIRAACLLALAAPCLSRADTAADLQALRDEIKSMRSQYEERIRALESRLQAAEASAAAAQPAAPPAPPPAAVAAAPVVAPVAPVSGTGFNPALSLILSGLLHEHRPRPGQLSHQRLRPAAGRGDRARHAQLQPRRNRTEPVREHRPVVRRQPDPGLCAGQQRRRSRRPSCGPLRSGSGLTLKAGRFLSSIGYLNSQHAHTWDFVDAPLAYQAMLGTQYGDDGLQLAWLAPIDQYLELRAELGRGRSFPGGDWSGNGAGMTALSLHTGGDIGISSSWRAGLSALQRQGLGPAAHGFRRVVGGRIDAFSGRTDVWVADAVWKWAPQGNVHAHQRQAAGRVPPQHARRHAGGRRGRARQRRALPRRAIGLVPARRLPVHAALARRAALRAPRPGHARLWRQCGLLRRRRLATHARTA